MVLFWPIQQELDCINGEGCILGKIRYDNVKDQHLFFADNESIQLTPLEKANIEARLLGLDSGQFSIAMQDDD